MRGPCEKINILIVDDRQEHLIVLESVLEGLDCHIIRATGDAALACLLQEEIAVLLLDG